MKIDNNDVSRSLRTSDGVSNKRGVATLQTGGMVPAAAVGSVKISDASRSLQAAGGTEAPFDSQRVEAIKAAISAGQFKVDPEAVADKLIASVGQLLTGKS